MAEFIEWCIAGRTDKSGTWESKGVGKYLEGGKVAYAELNVKLEVKLVVFQNIIICLEKSGKPLERTFANFSSILQHLDKFCH